MRSNVYARSTATVLFLLFLACALTACKRNSTRPETAPTPPRVACPTPPTQYVPPVPPLAEMDTWAIEVMGQIEADATARVAQENCMTKLRAAGVIR
jgi:hypothetical protein